MAPVDIVRSFLDCAPLDDRMLSFVSPDAVFIDLSPSRGALRHQDHANVAVGRSEFASALASVFGPAAGGDLIITSMFGNGRDVAGFGTKFRVEGPTLKETTSPVSIWAKVSCGRIHFFQYLEFIPLCANKSAKALLSTRLPDFTKKAASTVCEG
jgi:hypothetical protein